MFQQLNIITDPMQTNIHTHNPLITVTPPPHPPSGGGDSREFWGMHPAAGFKFRPTDKEIIVEYLMKKINNEELPPSIIHTAQLYAAFGPDQLSERFRPCGVNEWYFFTPREKRYKNGSRPSRAAGDGFWKPTDTIKEIVHRGEIIGSRRTLAYCKGTPEKFAKTLWSMKEFTVTNSSTTQVNTMRLDDWVLCKVYKLKQKKTSQQRS